MRDFTLSFYNYHSCFSFDTPSGETIPDAGEMWKNLAKASSRFPELDVFENLKNPVSFPENLDFEYAYDDNTTVEFSMLNLEFNSTLFSDITLSLKREVVYLDERDFKPSDMAIFPIKMFLPEKLKVNLGTTVIIFKIMQTDDNLDEVAKDFAKEFCNLAEFSTFNLRGKHTLFGGNVFEYHINEKTNLLIVLVKRIKTTNLEREKAFNLELISKLNASYYPLMALNLSIHTSSKIIANAKEVYALAKDEYLKLETSIKLYLLQNKKAEFFLKNSERYNFIISQIKNLRLLEIHLSSLILNVEKSLNELDSISENNFVDCRQQWKVTLDLIKANQKQVSVYILELFVIKQYLNDWFSYTSSF